MVGIDGFKASGSGSEDEAVEAILMNGSSRDLGSRGFESTLNQIGLIWGRNDSGAKSQMKKEASWSEYDKGRVLTSSWES